MARPPKNNCDYFSHDAGMRNHKKVKAIRSTFGIKGYGIWVMLIEHLTGSDGNVFPYTEMEFELMAGDFGVSVTEIRDVVDYCIRIEMLFNHNGFINSDSLDERLASVYAKRGKAKEISKGQLRLNGQFISNNTAPPGVSVTEMPQRKVKERKVKESKEDDLFILFWNKYGKKVNQNKCLAKWRKISIDDKEKIMKHLDPYIESKPDPQYRLNPFTYLNNEGWNDEIISKTEPVFFPQKTAMGW